MERLLSFEKLDLYFESLAEKHIDIKDYCGDSIDELMDKIASVDGFGSPGLVLFGYKWKLSGPEQRTFNTRTISFSILYSKIEKEDYAGQVIAVNNAEMIGLEILSRINVHSKTVDSGWLYNNFIKDSCHADPVRVFGPDGFFGMDFHFDLKVPEPLIVDPVKWTDGNAYCTS